jgi:hypothetical protein
MPNPFFYSGRVTDPARFVGRHAELRRIFSLLETAHTGQLQSVSIVGPRRIGRSSLLYHVTQVYPDRLNHPHDYLFTYIDLQSGACSTLDGLLATILRELLGGVSLRSDTAEGQKLRQLRRAGAVDLVAFQQGLELIGRPPGLNRRLVVCLDEFERLVQDPGTFPLDLYHAWRSLVNDDLVAFITVSQTPLAQLSAQEQLTSPFFNIFTSLPLGELTPGEADELVGWGRTCDRPFSDDECRRLRELAGCHPYCLQVAGSLLYQARAGGSAVDWKALERAYHQQVDPVVPQPPSRRWRILRRVGQALRWLVLSPRYLGRLARRVKPFWEEAKDWLAGVVIIVVVVLIVLGIITWGDVQDLVEGIFK